MTIFRKKNKVTLTRTQALYLSYCLERLRLGYTDGGYVTNDQIVHLEQLVDSQIWAISNQKVSA